MHNFKMTIFSLQDSCNEDWYILVCSFVHVGVFVLITILLFSAYKAWRVCVFAHSWCEARTRVRVYPEFADDLCVSICLQLFLLFIVYIDPFQDRFIPIVALICAVVGTCGDMHGKWKYEQSQWVLTPSWVRQQPINEVSVQVTIERRVKKVGISRVYAECVRIEYVSGFPSNPKAYLSIITYPVCAIIQYKGELANLIVWRCSCVTMFVNRCVYGPDKSEKRCQDEPSFIQRVRNKHKTLKQLVSNIWMRKRMRTYIDSDQYREYTRHKHAQSLDNLKRWCDSQ